ncbi:uncharacterized protein ASCRUDRAFT_77563 [Ascoidea rubescens DSM 1968]|uniref:RRM domain-containing protein n=1 Tax=Ascoidea rubescens DSM 1968 TaxID=1344418 RepID=A0A1D2VB53_9ASCO|nr:hypothetical protein ASCRUDRAFT_77563 [Ascoidea rubescens DSM 1968]ODV58830.1 hypothetical protein ASCRUDRAFT_77563 [Ascoidea rubescens DSM 1968]
MATATNSTAPAPAPAPAPAKTATPPATTAPAKPATPAVPTSAPVKPVSTPLPAAPVKASTAPVKAPATPATPAKAPVPVPAAKAPTPAASSTPVAAPAVPKTEKSVSPAKPSTTATTSTPPASSSSFSSIPASDAHSSDSDVNLDSRLYIGNVDYQTTEEELLELFQDFKIDKVDIPKRRAYNRVVSKGYAFINLQNKDDIDSLVSKFDNTEFNKRYIYIRKAQPKNVKSIDPTKKKTRSFNKNQKKPSFKKDSDSDITSGSDLDSDYDSDSNSSPATTKKSHQNKTHPFKPFNKSSEQKSHQNGPKPLNKSTPLEDGVPSKTTVYISNVDFYLNKAGLKSILKEKGYNPVWIKVPTRKLPFKQLFYLRKHNKIIKGRGFAFVRFEDEGTQLKFIKEFNGEKLNNREIKVQVAIDSRVEDSHSESESESDSEHAPESKPSTKTVVSKSAAAPKPAATLKTEAAPTPVAAPKADVASSKK